MLRVVYAGTSVRLTNSFGSLSLSQIALGPYGGMEFVISEPIAPKEITVWNVACSPH